MSDMAMSIRLEDNMNLVYWVLNKYFGGLTKRKSSFYDYEDLVQTGLFGLVKASKAYDASQGQFSTFATIIIKNEICRFLEKENKESVKRYDAASEDFTAEDLAEDTESYENEQSYENITELETRLWLDGFFEKLEKSGSKHVKEKRTLLELRYMGYKTSEAAKIMGISEMSLNNYIRDLRKEIKKEWAVRPIL